MFSNTARKAFTTAAEAGHLVEPIGYTNWAHDLPAATVTVQDHLHMPWVFVHWPAVQQLDRWAPECHHGWQLMLWSLPRNADDRYAVTSLKLPLILDLVTYYCLKHTT